LEKTVNYVDVILLIPLAYGAFRGLSRGLIVEVSTLFALLAGVYVALRCSGMAEGFLQDFVAIPAEYSYYVAFAIIFLLVVIVIHALGKLLTRLARLIALGLVNRLLGMLFGVARMAVVVCAVLFLLDIIDQRYGIVGPGAKAGSLLYEPLVNLAGGVYDAVIH
jgi:membrane protein required for colicin V production